LIDRVRNFLVPEQAAFRMISAHPLDWWNRPLYGLGVTLAKILSIGQGPLATPAEVASHHQGEACDCKNIAYWARPASNACGEIAY
jgi:hypothetical protein